MGLLMKYDFYIKPPKWIRNDFITITATSFIGLLIFLALYFSEILNVTIYITLSAVFGVLMVVGICGIISYFGRCFYCKKGTYCSKKPFSKTQTAKVKEIDHVEVISTNKALTYVKIIFWGKDGKILINFSDDGWVFKHNRFVRNLEKNHIKIVETKKNTVDNQIDGKSNK